MLFSKKLAGALAVAAALAVAPAAVAAPTGPGVKTPAESTTSPGNTGPSQLQRALCLYWYNAAVQANEGYWQSVQFPDDPDWQLPDGTGGGRDESDDGRDEYNALWADYQEAAQNYERLNCGVILGMALPDWQQR